MSIESVAPPAPSRDELTSCPCVWAEKHIAEYEAGIRERRTEEELVEAIREDERELGREMSAGELRAFALAFFSPTYDTDLFAEMLMHGAARVVGRGLPIKDDSEEEGE